MGEFFFRNFQHVYGSGKHTERFFIVAFITIVFQASSNKVYLSDFCQKILVQSGINQNVVIFKSDFHGCSLPWREGIYKDMLQGFRYYLLESELSPVSFVTGIAELTRLDRGHFFFGIPVHHTTGSLFMNGNMTSLEFASANPLTAFDIQKKLESLNADKNSLVIVSFPKRWKQNLPHREDYKELFGQMLQESGKSINYVWGMFSKWNIRLEQIDQGSFYRNPEYHANDSLLEKWLAEHPVSKPIQQAIPLDKQPRVFGQYLLNQGRQAFHGYSSAS